MEVKGVQLQNQVLIYQNNNVYMKVKKVKAIFECQSVKVTQCMTNISSMLCDNCIAVLLKIQPLQESKYWTKYTKHSLALGESML